MTGRSPGAINGSLIGDSSGSGALLERGQPGDRRSRRITAHLMRGLQARADRRPIRASEDQTLTLGTELNAGHAGRLALRHAGNRRGNGRRGAARPATGAALHRLR